MAVFPAMPVVVICVIAARLLSAPLAPLPACPAAVVEAGQAAFGGFFVLVGQVEARLIHGFADHVIADVPGAAEAVAQVAGVHGPHGGDGVAFDAGDLDQAADGVAGEAQVVLQGNFRRILHLVQVEPIELGQAAGGHGAGHAHLCLAAALGPGDGGVPLGRRTEGRTPAAPQVGAVTMIPLSAFCSDTA